MLEWKRYQHRVFKSSQGECECLKAEQFTGNRERELKHHVLRAYSVPIGDSTQ